MAGRFILGFGSSLNGRMAGLLISEVAHPQNRAKASAIVNYIYLGTVSGPPLTPGWRWPPSASLATGHGRSLTLLQAFPVVLVLAFIHWIPESPRWLVAKERYEEAEQMLALYHGNGDWANKTVAFGFREIEQTLALEFQRKKSISILDFARTAGNRYRVLLLVSLAMVSQFSGSNLFSNYANNMYEGASILEQTNKILVRWRGGYQPPFFPKPLSSPGMSTKADGLSLQLSGGQTILSLVVSG